MKATVLGSSGFIGTALVHHLRGCGYDVDTPTRAELPALSGDLGAAFYCIGMTGNFRVQPHDTVRSQASLLSELMERCTFSSFVYLSSTRVYGTDSAAAPMTEDQPISVLPSPDTTYDLAKLLGEALCAAHPGERLISARLSNVYGPGMSATTFLGSVLASVSREGHVDIGEDPASAKDYVSIDDVTRSLTTLAERGDKGCYNIASGRPVSHGEIATRLETLGATVNFRQGAPRRTFPEISVDKLHRFCDFAPRFILDDLADLLASISHTEQGTPHV